MRTSALQALRPGPGRLAGAVAAALLTGALGWFVGADPGRSGVAAVAALALVLLLRVDVPLETRWPDPPSRRSRPGWHAVAGVQRAVETARADPDDRRSLARRLDALDAGGRDGRTDAVRAAVGLPAPGTRRRR